MHHYRWMKHPFDLLLRYSKEEIEVNEAFTQSTKQVHLPAIMHRVYEYVRDNERRQ